MSVGGMRVARLATLWSLAGCGSFANPVDVGSAGAGAPPSVVAGAAGAHGGGGGNAGSDEGATAVSGGAGGATTTGGAGAPAAAGGAPSSATGPADPSRTDNWGLPAGDPGDDLSQARCSSSRAAESLHTKVSTASGSLDLWAWIPPDVCFVRCAVAYFSHDDDGSLVRADDLRLLAARHACALWSAGITWNGKWHRPALDGTGAALVAAFDALAAEGHRPELRHVPLATTGMSIDATFVTNLALMLPERTIAVAPLHGGGLTEPDVTPGAETVAWAFVTGEADGVLTPAAAAENLRLLRGRGAAAAIAVQPHIGHDPGQFRGFVFPFLDAAITDRLPRTSPADAVVPLMKLGDTRWLGNNDTREASRADAYGGDRARASWLASEFVARRWQALWQGALPKTFTK